MAKRDSFYALRRFKEPFNLVVLKPGSALSVGPSGECIDTAEQVTWTVMDISHLEDLGKAMLAGEVIEGPPLVIQFAILRSLGCLELEPE